MLDKEKFIKFILYRQVLSFGAFHLKSGRIAPYFFDLGKICDAEGLLNVGNAYAKAILSKNLNFDVLFGPAYKGINIGLSAAFALYQHNQNFAVCFNRKEVKTHGEGGMFVGADVQGKRVILVDDVLTAGTAIRESADLLRQAGAELVAIFVALDRQEKSAQHPQLSTLDFLAQELGVPVYALITFTDVMFYLRKHDIKTNWPVIDLYRKTYGYSQKH